MTVKCSSYFPHERCLLCFSIAVHGQLNSLASSRVSRDLIHYLTEIEASLFCQRIAPEKQRSIVSNIETAF